MKGEQPLGVMLFKGEITREPCDSLGRYELGYHRPAEPGPFLAAYVARRFELPGGGGRGRGGGERGGRRRGGGAAESVPFGPGIGCRFFFPVSLCLVGRVPNPTKIDRNKERHPFSNLSNLEDLVINSELHRAGG